eukprot:scaffold64098_cov53-Attheya_sp.AAC.4
MLLLSEEADVLMLSTNSLKNDMNSSNKFVAGLALCTIGNLATADMSRDLAPEVDKHLKSPQPYLRKKACLAMSRCLTKCPDMVEDFVERTVSLLKDRSHGVLITVLQLMTQVLVIDMEVTAAEGMDPFESPCRVAFVKLVPSLVKLLRNLLSMGFAPDHDVGGISDPFLQVQILTLFRLLGAGDEKASEEMNDVLAQVATNTETSKNAGNAILYECVQTIMAVESEDGLRVLAVNILGRFLLNRDNNIRYVALNTLARCVVEQKQVDSEDAEVSEEGANTASSALQRHRTMVVDCLKDPDISIRQRALELIYHLVNHDNVETLTAELLNYLVLCPREHRADICTRILRVVEKFSPDDRWRVDTLITMLTIAGRECTREVQSSTIVYISRSSDELRACATHKLMKAIRDDDGGQRGLLVVGIWCIGEYGDMLLSPYTYTTAPGNEVDGNSEPVTISFMSNEPSEVVDTVEEVTKRHSCPENVKEAALTCFTKLTDRFSGVADSATLDRLHSLVKAYKGSYSLELQLRSCEYTALLNAVKGLSMPKEGDDVFATTEGGTVSDVVSKAAKEALARMPVVDLKVMRRKAAKFTDSGMDMHADRFVPSEKPAAAKSSGDQNLLDLEDIFGGGSSSAPAAPASQQNGGGDSNLKSTESGSGIKGDLDLLGDIFSAPTPVPTAPAPAPAGGFDPFSGTPQMQQQPPVGNISDLFGASPPAPVATPVSAPDPFGGVAASMQQPVPVPVPTPVPTSVPASTPPMTTAAPDTGVDAGSITVPAFTHAGISVEFECTKPEIWNKQNSVLVAKFKNSSGAPIYGLNLQCAVPKYVTMEMTPPTSTTVPVTGGQGKEVTQTVKITNTMLGTKNLMLKLKISFTSNGNKIEHMATCSGFPAGAY